MSFRPRIAVCARGLTGGLKPGSLGNCCVEDALDEEARPLAKFCGESGPKEPKTDGGETELEKILAVDTAPSFGMRGPLLGSMDRIRLSCN